MKARNYKVSRSRAIEIVMNTNGVTKEIAERYTDSEIKEVLKLIGLKADF